jgi:hypothetical protein
MDDFLDRIESIGGVPQHVPDAYSDMRNAVLDKNDRVWKPNFFDQQ